MDVRYLLLLILLVSCLPQSEVGQGNLSDGSSTPTSQSSGTSTSIPEAETQWNYLGTLSKSILINVSNLNNSYVSGKEVETFLNTTGNFAQDYCLISRYSISGLSYELRSRAVPISYYDFTSKRTVKIFRIDFNDLTNSQGVCGSAPLLLLDANENYVTDTSLLAQSTFNPSLICPTCTSNLSSNKLMILRKTPLDLRQLKLSEVNISGLTLAVDPNNSSTISSGTCSQSQCINRGFDCCLDNQCIKDGSIRPSATTLYSSQLQAAEQERLNNPLSYLNYPQLYYICGSSIPTTTTGGSSGSYEQGLTQLKKDYFCVEYMKKNKTGATFHQDLLTGLNFFLDQLDDEDKVNIPSTLYPTDIECRNNADSTSTMYYKKVAERLYQNCGCSKTTLADMVAYCPAYEYSVNYFENSGLPNRIDCYTPPTGGVQIPNQQTVSVNSRSAPHRYFRTCGEEFGTSATCSGGNDQEGDVFDYQDEGKILPVQESFGMNSILGQMNVSLDKAMPAKSITVEYNQVYQISTTSGFYSPCPSCGKDSWFTSFSPYPTSGYGTGLQAVGHSTSRDAYDFNTTSGNYEDTIFGRACWIPPTMIPFTHRAGSTTQSQRLTRLKTQAALFANGYQRDWYGFNKGALIGSFDGVTWFAVGKGRIVLSTSKKLFLAINAPFADLANPTLHVVNVQAYDGITQAAQVDYDPQYHLSHPYQNEAGNCQANHLCSTDTDCVTRLGWEYMCADVQGLQTQWPEFDSDAKEKAGTSVVLTLDQILQQKRFPSSSTKRCVYRGSGSLCVQTPTVVADLNKRKTVTCAPNFYCANVNTSGAVFNNKVSRYGSTLEEIPVTKNHYFGKDANVLGRPLNYVSTGNVSSTLQPDIRLSLTQNMVQYESGATALTGLCLPGKALPEQSNQATLASPFEQHKAADAQGRTDFISQIGGCNSGLFTSYRYSSCPVMGTDGNYEFLTTSYSFPTYHLRARNQNSCGLDSLYKNVNLTTGVDNLLSSSPFKNIEAKPLHSQTVIEPTFARDACLRRAGQVCHTDLDCGPNKMHADQTENYNVNYFGNEAEKKYYSEYLVCGQADAKPSPLDSLNYKAFSMNKNRCCREVGSDLTTYTSFTPTAVNPTLASNQNTTQADDTYNAISFGLKMALAPGVAPNDPSRYSRLATVENLNTTSRPVLTAYQDKTGSLLKTDLGPNVMTGYQWKTLSEANSESCCGGGWIRKFSDGTNDWTKRDRLYLDVKNFACINSRTPLLTNPKDVVGAYSYNLPFLTTLLNQDFGDYCKESQGATDKGSCAQFSIEDSLNDNSPTSIAMNLPFNFETLTASFVGSNTNYYFYPRSADGDSNIKIEYGVTGGRRNFKFKLPSFFPTKYDANFNWSYPTLGPSNNAMRVSIYGTGNPAGYSCIGVPAATSFDFADPTQDVHSYCDSIAAAGCCFKYDSSNRILSVMPGSVLRDAGLKILGNKTWGIRIKNVISGADYLIDSAHKDIASTSPGSNTHYLKRLGKLELSGIPQISYEPLYCNDNSERVVPGIFKKTNVTDMMRGDFTAADFSFYQTLTDPDSSAPATSAYYTNRHGLDQEPIFSESDFKCCTPLGKTNKEQSKCCSGYGVQGTNGSYTCALPGGTDLMVYFNRFVSNEGVGTDKPGGGLVDADFNFLTGEPRITTAINQKISALGKAYCESKKVRQGGAFGEFNLEPSGNDTNLSEKLYGIVDSTQDEGKLSSAGATIPVGYSAFMSGFRWNHHLYCQD